jgi:23S rRNA pseudouridine2605 synthase
MSKNPESERIQKYLSGIGVGSRRKIESWISEGRITVDGKVASPGERVTRKSRISIDGRPIRSGHSAKQSARKQRVILYNKPEGEICTRSDPGGRPTVFRNLPHLKGERWVCIGRLDINTSGLLLFSNDGELANHLMHPGLGLEREYLCRVFGDVDKAAIEKLTSGVELDGRLTRFHQIRRQRGEGRNTWFSVVVMEGKYREVRRLWESVECRLSRLNRIRYGKIGLPRGLKPGDWVELEVAQIDLLARNLEKDRVVIPRPPKSSADRRKRR